MLPVSEACERNKRPILGVLRDAFAQVRSVLEVGSGTGQHAVYFAANLPHLTWQPSDLAENLSLLQQRLRLEAPPNVLPPIELDVRSQPWSPALAGGRFDGVFSANTLHIMAWEAVEDLFRGLRDALTTGGVLSIYGPFRYGGAYTTPSNAEFDRFLQQRDPQSGIRDFEAVNTLAAASGLELVDDHAMPANNQMLLWRKP